MPRQGRVDSTVELKEHEKHLMQLTLDPGFVEALTALALGESITGDNDLSQYLKIHTPKISGEVGRGLTISELEKLCRKGKLPTDSVRVEGKWVPTEEGGDWRINYGDNPDGESDEEKLLDTVKRIMPRYEETTTTEMVPVTVLLPNNIPTDAERLADVKSAWLFARVGDRYRRLASQQERAALSLRLLTILQALKAMGTTIDRRKTNGAFVQRLLKTAPIPDAVRPMRKGSPETKGVVQQGEIIEKIQKGRGVAKELDSLNRQWREMEESTFSVDLPTHESVYPGIHQGLYPELLKEQNSNKYSYWMLRFSPRKNFAPPPFKKLELSFRYTSGSNDGELYLRENQYVREALLYLFSMTSGVAITFYVERAEEKRKKDSGDLEKGLGLLQPALIIPRPWHDLLRGLKDSPVSPAGPAMSDDKYSSNSIQKGYQKALRAPYQKKRDEVLRAYTGGVSVPPVDPESTSSAGTVKYLGKVRRGQRDD